MRLQHRKDVTHDMLTKWLTDRGWMVFDTHNISGFVDAIGVFQGRVCFLEYKTGKAKPKASQEALHAHLRASGAEVAVVATEADCEAYFVRPFSGWYDEKQMKQPA
jgi:RecB family exonuclease